MKQSIMPTYGCQNLIKIQPVQKNDVLISREKHIKIKDRNPCFENKDNSKVLINKILIKKLIILKFQITARKVI